VADRPAALIAAFAAALVASLLSFMTIAAVLPNLIAEWRLTGAEAGWIGGILFAGYVVSALGLAPLTDRMDPKRIYLGAAAVGAIGAFGFALFADGLWSAMLFRFLTGIGIGGTHMPGLKALTDQLDAKSRSRGVVYYTAVFALGSGLSIYVGGEAAAWFGWRWAFAIGGLGFLAAAAIVAIVLPAKAAQPRARQAGHALDFRPVLRNRAAVGYMLAAIGTAWEVFASRVWLVTFFVMLQVRDGGAFALNPTTLATLLALIGVPASMLIGEAANRYPRTKLLIAVAGVSAVSALGVGLAVGAPYEAVVALCFLFCAVSYGRNAANTGGAVAAAEPHLRGTTLALNAAVSFSGGLIGPTAAGVALDLGGGVSSPFAWQVCMVTIALGPAVSMLALYFLVQRAPITSR
jgi:MFS family permease